MLTPVEEAGLAGMSVAARARKALYQLPEAELAALLLDLDAEARARHLVYLHDGRETVVRVLALPVPALPEQLAYVRAATLALHGALKRLPELYFADPDVRAALLLPPAEEEWLRRAWTPAARALNTVFGRHDAVVDFASASWKSTLHFLEPNLGGIGGLHLVPTAERIVAERVVPRLHARDPELLLERGQDIRDLLMQEMLDHLEALGRAPRVICFVDPKYSGVGPDEQAVLAEYLHARFGVEVLHADPAELTLDGDEVRYAGRVIDLAYRDYTVTDLLELEAGGADVAPMRALFAQNRLVSGIAAELDQKSCWEVLGDPALADRHFTAEERQLFRRHLPWTRVLCARTTTLADGARGDLVEHVLRERESLVLKPNRAWGGKGVHLGVSTAAEEWDRLVAAAVRAAAEGGERWVVQRAVDLPVKEFPVRDNAGRVQAVPFFTVYGFAPSTYGLAVLGRASQKQVVNVAQYGGMFVSMIGHPPGTVVL